MRLLRLALLLPFTLALALAACSPAPESDNANRLSIAATAVPHAEILEFIKPELEKDGLYLDIRIFNDYVQPNAQVAQGRIDVNNFQTGPYLSAYNRDHGTGLVALAGIHIEPFGAYSRRIDSLDTLPDGAQIAIPNDPSNLSRALLLLHRNGLIQVRDPSAELVNQRDISQNPKSLGFRELDAAMLPRVLDQVDLALINTNYALAAQLDPSRDALLLEDKDSPTSTTWSACPTKATTRACKN